MATYVHEATITRAQARRLIDCIPDEPEYAELVNALDSAQGDANDVGEDGELVVNITGARL
jgi:hypothetical protein